MITINLSSFPDLKSYISLFLWDRSLLTSLYPQPWLIMAKFSNIFVTHVPSFIFYSLSLLFPSYILISNRPAFLNSIYLNTLMLEKQRWLFVAHQIKSSHWAWYFTFQWFPYLPVPFFIPIFSYYSAHFKAFPHFFPTLLHHCPEASSSTLLPCPAFLNCAQPKFVAPRDSNMPLIPSSH